MVQKVRWAALACVGTVAVAAVSGIGGAAIGAPEPGTTVVRGTDFPVGTGLAHVGCASPFDAGSSPATPYVAQGPGTAPLGSRSLGFDLAGGDAAGPVAYTGSLAAAGPASLAAHAASGTTGVAWVGYHDLDGPDGEILMGRADLVVPAGGWTTLSTAGLTFTWARYDVETGQQLGGAEPAATVAGLLATRGDGPGMAALTLGCDGAPFAVDAMRFDSQTYDLEGLDTSTAVDGGDRTLVAGQTTTIRGSLAVTPAVAVPRATAILERNVAGSGWETVRVVEVGPGGALSAVVEPPERTAYRWRFVDRPLAEGSTSDPVVVDVARAVTAERSDGAVVGRVSPGRAGLAVSLRRAGSGDVVARTTTDADGRYTFAAGDLADLAGGPYVVAVAAADTNLRGESDPVRLGADGGPQQPAPTSKPTGQPTAKPTEAPTPEPTRTPEPTPQQKPEQKVEPSTPASPTPSAPAGPATSVEPTPAGQPQPVSPEPTDASPTPAG